MQKQIFCQEDFIGKLNFHVLQRLIVLKANHESGNVIIMYTVVTFHVRVSVPHLRTNSSQQMYVYCYIKLFYT